jgi:hypothetical protein
MLRVGKIGLGLAALCVALLFVLSPLHLVQFGPCGPDPLGLVLFLGVLVGGGLGFILMIAGAIRARVREVRSANQG